MLDVVFLLHMGKGLIYVVSLSVVVHPNPYEVFSVIEVAWLGVYLQLQRKLPMAWGVPQ